MNLPWTLYEFTIPLHSPLKTRSGLIIKLEHSDGTIGWGEVSPLEGRSRETLHEAKQQLIAALTHPDTSIPLFPSVACGLEHAQKKELPSVGSLPLCALLCGTKEEILAQAHRASLQGYRTVKIKISNLSVSDASCVLHALIPLFKLRVDVNQMWNFQESLSFFSQFDPNAFEYIEDPCYDIEHLHQFSHPFALDESLSRFQYDQLRDLKQLTALIVKPTLTGGINPCLAIKKLADTLNIKLILSSTWESGLGILQICSVAQQLTNTHHPLGLDTYRFIQEDLLATPLDFSQPELHLPSELHLNMHLLQKVAHG